MIVRVDKSWDDDPVGSVHHSYGVARHIDARADFADFAVFDQHVRLGEVTNLAIKRQDYAALDENAARAQEASEFRVRGARALRECDARNLGYCLGSGAGQSCRA